MYDDSLGLFVYARLEGGAFVSTGVPVTGPPPRDAAEHGQESPEARRARIERRRAPGATGSGDTERAEKENP